MNWPVVANDVHTAAKRIRRHPKNPLVLVITLAVAVGSVVGIFDLARQVLHAPLPYRQPDRIVVAGETVSPFLVSVYDWQHNPRDHSIFRSIAEYRSQTTLFDSGSGGRKLTIADVTPHFFSVLGVRMALGSGLPDTPPTPPSHRISWMPMVVSHHMWQKYLGSNPDIVGHTIRLKFLPPYRFLVVGVAPAGVRFPSSVDAWIPEHLFGTSMAQTDGPGGYYPRSIARLRPGVSVPEAEAAIRSWSHTSSEWLWNHSVRLTPFRKYVGGEFYRAAPMLWLLTILFLTLVVAAAVNICHREFEARDQEMRIRQMIGGRPRRLLWMLGIEVMALLLLAMAGAFFVRYAVLQVTLNYVLLPVGIHTSLTWMDVAIAGGAMLLSAALVLIPEAMALGVLPQFGLRRWARLGGSRPISQFRIPIHVAAATMILVTAAVLLRTASEISHISPGVRAKGVFVGEVALPFDRSTYLSRHLPTVSPKATAQAKQQEIAKQEQVRIQRTQQFAALMNLYFSSIVRRVKADARVTDAGVISIAPYSGYPPNTFGVVVSRVVPTKPPYHVTTGAQLVTMSAGAAKAMGLTALQGHGFGVGSAGELGKNAVLVNEAMARKIGSGGTSLGRYVWPPLDAGSWPRIVGIVNNVRAENIFAQPVPTIYYPSSVIGMSDMDVVFHVSENMPVREASSILQKAVERVSPDAVISHFAPMENMIASADTLTRYMADFLLALAVVGVFIVAVCAWAESSGEVRRREHEMGIRLAIGAEPGQLVQLMLWRLALPSLVAATLGAIAGWWISQVMAYMFHGLEPRVGMFVCGAAIVETYVVLVSILALRRGLQRNPRDMIGEGAA
ncbi:MULTISPECIES: ABC transporter permease [Acidobacterium]|uniref:Permease, putative domain protein n=1 Tax=Acidobacterium capsulatum (strain ATCC 51196 / DSM 11244 / BCRC 80197 / JCM 7670 / NBRC 15755 / NCIMB 13165 / 161) TaxID=240015 RepID=C1F6M2_ACIC5|nr:MULTISPECIES: ABC transporter permease [Acidobacterium]ACO33428.1 permease, putative domain protein [Acidobacterium capsulatum ATCC 51196]HCT60910.1 hypothetical protein [Acidobacterium sp.]